MKKLLTVFLAGSLALTMFTACNSGGDSTPAPAPTPAPAASQEDASTDAVTSPTQATGEPIRIGLTMPVTGPYANMGIPELEGFMTAAYAINKKGGINGRPVEFIHADVTDVASAKGETDRLINQEKVVAMTGTYNSTLSLAVAETCNRYDTVYFEASSYGTAISQSGFTTTIRHSPNADQVGQILVDVLIGEIAPEKLGKPAKDLKICFASEDGVWGTNNVNSCVALLEKAGLADTVKLTEFYAADTKDLSTMVLKLKAI